MSGTVDEDHLGPGLRRALGTRAISQQRKLASTMPDKYFKELQWLELTSPSSSTVSLKIISLLRLPRKSAKCGSLLMIITPAGKVTLDDTDMSFEEDIGGLFQEAGFKLATEVTDNEGRRLRMLAAEGFTATGFFNVIDDADWGCTTVSKPEFPEVFSMQTQILTKCIDKDGQDICKIRFNDKMVPSIGLVSYQGVKYLMETSYTLQDEGGSTTILQSPHHPGVRTVTRSSAGQTITYQIDHNGKLSHCRETNSSAGGELPDDFIFQYIGEVGDMRQFRISYQTEGAGGVKSDWEHFDYFDDKEGKFPRVMIDNHGNVNNFKEFKGGEEMISFRQFNIRVEETFEKCAAVTKMLDTNEFLPFLKRFYKDELNLTYGVTYSGELEDLEEGSDDYVMQIWNWSEPYPPVAGDAIGMDMEDLTYYLEENHEDQRWYDWFNHTVSGITEEIEQTSRRLLAESHDPRRLSDYDESEVLSMESKIKHLSRDVRGRRLGLSVNLNFAQKRVMVKYSSSRFSVYLKASPGRFKWAAMDVTVVLR